MKLVKTCSNTWLVTTWGIRRMRALISELTAVRIISLSIRRTRGSEQPIFLFGNYLVDQRRQVQSQRPVHDHSRLSHREGVGLEHGEQAGAVFSGGRVVIDLSTLRRARL